MLEEHVLENLGSLHVEIIHRPENVLWLCRTEEMTHGFTKLTVIELFNCLLEI
ncbi:9115_t:CDS:2 [Entrophospora sp. SA101]|nr:9115_t:CDS:2 [Entrophospora sp. SA101]CAJ0830832.1 2016_t:CDS:2 [Entrophospora sp. SA101]